VTRETGDPTSAEADGLTEADAGANGSSAPDEGETDRGGAGEQPLDLPLDALMDWGTDPRYLEKALEAQTEEALLAAERDEYLDALRRLQADFDNFRKRSMRQQTELLERATEGLCVRLLPVLDALDLATAHLRDQGVASDASRALEQIDSLLRGILSREGIERIDAVGVPFDPTIHDAVGHLPPKEAVAEPGPGGPTLGETALAGEAAEPGTTESDEETPPGEAGPGETGEAVGPDKSAELPGSLAVPTVAQVMRAGYRLKSKVLRPAMVLVGG